MRRAYNSSMRKFTTFCECYHVPDPFPVTEFLLCSFAASMADGGLDPQTVKSYMAAIRNTQLSLGLPDPREQSSLPVLKRVLAGISRSRLAGSPPSNCRFAPQDKGGIGAVSTPRKASTVGRLLHGLLRPSSGWGNYCVCRRLTSTPGCTSRGVTWSSTTPWNRRCSGSASASPRLTNSAKVWTSSSARQAVTGGRSSGLRIDSGKPAGPILPEIHESPAPESGVHYGNP
jgi:hypothetical protein